MYKPRIRNEWCSSSKKLGGFNCIKHRDDPSDLCLAGPHGLIWQCGAGQFGAFITSHKIVYRYLSRDKHPKDPGDEIRITFPEKELPIWVVRLGVPKTTWRQARYANAFGMGLTPQELAGVPTGAHVIPLNAPRFKVGQQVTYRRLGKVGTITQIIDIDRYALECAGWVWSVPGSAISAVLPKKGKVEKANEIAEGKIRSRGITPLREASNKLGDLEGQESCETGLRAQFLSKRNHEAGNG